MPHAIRLDVFFRDRLRRMEEAGVPEARLNLEWLVSRRLGIPRLELVLHGSDEIPPVPGEALDRDVKRMCAGEPLQYVLGDAPFHGLTIKTDRRALIPRPETEWLVDQALDCAPVWEGAHPHVADVGSGTGCIALALATARPQARVTAVDVDPDALELARENRDRLGLQSRLELRLGHVLDGFAECAFDGIVSNPPYIPSTVWKNLDRHVRDYEPRRALDGGEDGLSVIRQLASQGFRCLMPGKPLWIEIGFDQGPAVSELLSVAGFERVEIRKDWDGRDRAASGWKPA